MAEFPENIVHYYRELQAGTIAVQHSNSLIALAGCVHFVDMQKMKMMLFAANAKLRFSQRQQQHRANVNVHIRSSMHMARVGQDMKLL